MATYVFLVDPEETRGIEGLGLISGRPAPEGADLNKLRTERCQTLGTLTGCPDSLFVTYTKTENN